MVDCRTFIALVLIQFVVFPSIAQSEYSRHIAYDSLITKAKEQDKPMFFLVHQRSEQFSPYDGFSLSKRTKEMLREAFVSGIVRVAPEEFNHPLSKAYHLRTPIYFFTDKDGYPILRYNKQIKQEDTLLKLIDSAKTLAEGETMGKLLQQYKKGLRNQLLLRKLLKQYQIFDQYADQQVLNDYVSGLTVQELNNFETVVFLLRCGPTYDSPTYQLAYTNRKMVDSLYATLPLPTRKEINGRIQRQTFREALDKKNFALAQNLGNRVANTWQSNHLRGNIARSYYPMKYLQLCRDTVLYRSYAKNYYNTYFYRLDQDSLAKVDYANNQNMNIPRRGFLLDSVENLGFQNWLEKYRPRYVKTQVDQLNYGANQLLSYGKDNPETLFDGIRWMHKSVVLLPDRGQSHHILAKLLYQVGFYAEAEAAQRRAVELYRPQKHYYKRMQDVLKQMVSRSWSGI
ncbi:hypothetical protein FAZ19_04320 [Sphingobacterium alkalisoli]|uniref:Thioredoxin family protein n=1 Tax=Sphingobacterium alkalisoli TaxID=1874115 RepID=A0A4U0H9L3_9SPHI|nr:hypothetical protein [Sphingobacterium alkalisoli]TJY68486.1 hypothetical protein FAZ19_04320 [Sphingobacterium alkalisoli]GGH06160.1 hypothetical protein GCM10011418_02720 [Sphingobacterium alkalisoli]